MIVTDYSAGLCQADATLTYPHVTELLATIEEGDCLAAFNSKAFFDGWSTRVMLSEIMPQLGNFTRILDCVSCDRSRFNGKV